ncbi:hypothetical protein DXG01_015950, partial [Tephrocybe rancida]
KNIEPAETGRPETSAEYAARVARGFVLHGPKERKEDGSGEQSDDPSTIEGMERLTIKLPARKNMIDQTLPKTSNLGAQTPSSLEQHRDNDLASTSQVLQDQFDALPPISIEELLSRGREPIDLLASLRDRYEEDPLFKKIIEAPKAYKNFELEDGVLYMKTINSKLLCIPAIV